MDIKLYCRGENEAAIRDILTTNNIGIDEAAGVVMAEKGCENVAESNIKIIFTMRALPELIAFLKSAGNNCAPISMLLGKSNESYRPINVEDIAYINAVNNDVFIHDMQQKEYSIKYKLYQLEAAMLPDYFIRINKSEIVNIKRIDKIVPMFKGKIILYLEGYKPPLDISRNYIKTFKERLGLL